MSSSEPPRYCVVVRNNIVVAIETLAAAPDTEVAASPLDASTRLAANHRENGCLDGAYYFAEAETARRFAVLGLDFTRRVAERSIEHLNGAHIGDDGWRNPSCLPEGENEDS